MLYAEFSALWPLCLYYRDTAETGLSRRRTRSPQTCEESGLYSRWIVDRLCFSNSSNPTRQSCNAPLRADWRSRVESAVGTMAERGARYYRQTRSRISYEPGTETYGPSFVPSAARSLILTEYQPPRAG